MKSIRGAIAVVKNNQDSILDSSKLLLSEIFEQNSITEDDIESAIFTVTKELTKAFPAKAFRELEMFSVAAIDTLAPDIDGDLEGCIRVLINLNSDSAEVNHVYLGEAKNLRPDR